MAEAPSNTHNKRSLIRTSHVCHRRRAAERQQQVEEYKHIHTHTHTHTHTQSAKNISNCFLKGLLIAYSLFVVMEEFRFVTLFYYKNCIDKIIISYLSVQKQTDG